MRYIFRSIIGLMFITVFSCGPISNSTQEKLPPLTAQQIKLIDLDNQYVDLADYKGKTIFLNFWATWCKPCIEEMPAIAKAQELLKNEPVVFILASNEPKEKTDRPSCCG